MEYTYKADGICAKHIIVELNEDIIASVRFEGGNYCSGNCTAVPVLVQGKTIDEADRLLSNIDCKNKGTSCAAQLVLAAKEAYQKVSE